LQQLLPITFELGSFAGARPTSHDAPVEVLHQPRTAEDVLDGHVIVPIGVPSRSRSSGRLSCRRGCGGDCLQPQEQRVPQLEAQHPGRRGSHPQPRRSVQVAGATLNYQNLKSNIN